jgi:hypothetical protein
LPLRAKIALHSNTSMPCKKSDLVKAINSYATARATGDSNLINLAVMPLQQMVDSLEYEPEQQELAIEAQPEDPEQE